MTNEEAAKTLGILRTFIAERLRLEERLETTNRGTGIRTQATAQEEALRLAIAALTDEEPSQAPEPNGALREAAEKYRRTKYTPGPAPWTHTPEGIVDADGAFVVRDYEVSYNDARSARDDWKRWANRRSGNYRLILAAPEMLAALIATRECVYFRSMNRTAREAIEAAIAKAEGRNT
jgi:hypothetical protein